MKRLVLALVVTFTLGITVLGAGAAPASTPGSAQSVNRSDLTTRAEGDEGDDDGGPESNWGSVAVLGDAGFLRIVATNGGTEPSISVDPSNTNNIAVMSGFGGWNGNASIAASTDGGNTWA